MGVALADYDDDQHGHNENLRLGNLWNGTETFFPPTRRTPLSRALDCGVIHVARSECDFLTNVRYNPWVEVTPCDI
jgi:hypothetical protein